MIKVTCETHTAEELRRLARATREDWYGRRLRALALMLEGVPRLVVAHAQGVDRQTVAR